MVAVGPISCTPRFRIAPRHLQIAQLQSGSLDGVSGGMASSTNGHRRSVKIRESYCSVSSFARRAVSQHHSGVFRIIGRNCWITL